MSQLLDIVGKKTSGITRIVPIKQSLELQKWSLNRIYSFKIFLIIELYVVFFYLFFCIFVSLFGCNMQINKSK